MIDITTWLSNLGVIEINENINNQYEFYSYIKFADGDITYNQYDFYKKIADSRYEYFKQYINEREFYRNTNAPDIYDFKTFYENIRKYVIFNLLLDDYPAKAAYLLNKAKATYTGPCINVRRDSDNAVLDIGFTSTNLLDTAALTTFCTTPVNTYVSDFSTTEDFTEFNGNGTANESIGGVSEAYKFEITGGSTLHIAIFPAGVINENSTYDITFDYYIPSTNGALDGIQLRTNAVVDGTFNQTVLDSWQTATINNLTVTGNVLRIYALDGSSYTVDSNGDVFYLKNMVVTQTSAANGLVTKWYDQSGNGYDATQTVSSAQPKIVSRGTIITQYGKPAIEYNAASTWLDGQMSANDESKFSQIFLVKNTTIGTAVAFSGAVVLNDTQYSTTADDINFGNTEGLYVVDNINTVGYLNSVNVGSTGPTFTQVFNRLYFGSTNGSTSFSDGTIQAFILYDFNDDQSANRIIIEDSLNSYYNIFPQSNIITSNYIQRVQADGGVVEAQNYVYQTIENLNI